jgi:MFS family permease
MQQFQPAGSLTSRTFIGLICSQFLAAFNDQAIHAAAMFYAIHKRTLREDQAISLMPILFYAPWAIFCTLAGYYADRYSKRNSLVLWKVAEIGITLVALGGFLVGSAAHHWLGPWIVLSTVFLMGTHSSFFVPAKYGCMPEILQPHLLSRGNGILESTSFLAVILGTVSGGLLSGYFKHHEYWIGAILVLLAVIGAGASMLIQPMPAANPTRPFPKNPLKPLLVNLRIMIRSRPLALSLLGIAFFTFMVAFMRATVYMHGEVQDPIWSEFKTSLIVATVALGVGLGSYLAGLFSGGKVELGLVPLGGLGMIAAAAVAAVAIFNTPMLVVMLMAIGFFSGFYIVPLYTLLQHRAPKTSKGDLIATSNFINVTGAISASLLFFLLVLTAHKSGIAPPADDQEPNYAEGELREMKERNGRPVYLEILKNDGLLLAIGDKELQKEWDPLDFDSPEAEEPIVVDQDLLEVVVELKPAKGKEPGTRVAIASYRMHGKKHYVVRAADKPAAEMYDNRILPCFLFLGASLMAAGILTLLCFMLPDFFLRSVVWLRSLGRYRLKVIGMDNLPSDGPVILATNCARTENCLQVLTALDRFARFVYPPDGPNGRILGLLGYLTRRAGLGVLGARPSNGTQAADVATRALRVLRMGDMVGLPADGPPIPEVSQVLSQLRQQPSAVLLPVYCGEPETPAPEKKLRRAPRVRVVIGQALPAATPAEILRREIEGLRSSADGGTTVH